MIFFRHHRITRNVIHLTHLNDDVSRTMYNTADRVFFAIHAWSMIILCTNNLEKHSNHGKSLNNSKGDY